MENDVCDICGKEVRPEDMYHIDDTVGHFGCFRKRLTVKGDIKPKCAICGKPYVKVGEYAWKGDCIHIPKNLRLSIG